ncbi:MAG: matrixin family metalloprotease [Sinimarinibacterium sp.]|jgi:hypothetical protein
MEGQYRRILLSAAIGLLPATAQSFSYAPMTDAALQDQADAIVLAQVVDVVAEVHGPLPATRYRLRVDRRLKGPAFGTHVDVVVAGGSNPYGTLVVSGAPRFDADERALIFLRDRGDGTQAVMQYALGAFHVRPDASGRAVLLRDLSGARAVSSQTGGPADADPEPPRDLQRFATWLGDRAHGVLRPADYWLPRNGQNVEGAKYQLPQPTVVRWAEFDESRNVDWYAANTGLLGLLGSGYGEFQQALSAWNADAASTVQFNYRGTTTATGGLSHPDGINAIQFGDPDDVLGGSFDCLSGGVLATTGTWVRNAQMWAHGTYLPLAEADIVVQDGAACFLGLFDNANATELFAHELGHALGLAHPCGESPAPDCVAGSAVDDAVMRPVLHADGRGARLGDDDRAGIAYLYPTSTSPQQTAPPSTQEPGSGGGGGGSLQASELLALLLAWCAGRIGNSARLLAPQPRVMR